MESGALSPDPAAVAGCLKALSGREGVSEDYVRFRLELLEAQTAVREALAGAASPPSGADGAAGGPLRPRDVRFDHKLLAGLARDVAEALRRRGSRSRDVASFLAAATQEPAGLEELARKAAFGPDEAFLASVADRSGVPVEGLLFLGRALAAPFVGEAVRRLKERMGVAVADAPGPDAPGLAAPGRCPYCASPPGLAILGGEDGARVLVCALCGESWRFPRVACPFCGGRGDLGILSTSAAEPRWIETCGGCKGYLKTTDERKLPHGETVVPLVEATATLYLDLIAESQGYAPGLPYAALA